MAISKDAVERTTGPLRANYPSTCNAFLAREVRNLAPRHPLPPAGGLCCVPTTCRSSQGVGDYADVATIGTVINASSSDIGIIRRSA